MPFNLQILPPGPLIPVEHVWKLRKSLSLTCLTLPEELPPRGQTVVGGVGKGGVGKTARE